MYLTGLEDVLRNKTILVADDNPENLRVLSTILEQEGYRVRVAKDGAQAFESMRMEPPDLALLDVHMPKTDGYELCRLMQKDEKLQTVPVIFISALNETFNRKKAFEIGALDYIDKPIQQDTVLARIRNILLLDHFRKKCDLLERSKSQKPQ